MDPLLRTGDFLFLVHTFRLIPGEIDGNWNDGAHGREHNRKELNCAR